MFIQTRNTILLQYYYSCNSQTLLTVVKEYLNNILVNIFRFFFRAENDFVKNLGEKEVCINYSDEISE